MKVRLERSRKDIRSISKDLDKLIIAERHKTTRRMIKLLSIVLHERYHFGRKRITDVILDITDLINQGLDHWEGDLGDFWYKIDEKLDSINSNFYPSEDTFDKNS